MSAQPLAVYVSKLTKSYKNKGVLKAASIHVKEGTMYGLIGSSGCGKSTLLLCILNVLNWDSGMITVQGKTMDARNKVNPCEIGHMPQDIALFERLTVTETLRYFGKLQSIQHCQLNYRIHFVLDLMELSNLCCRRIDTLSGGQKRRTSLAIALLKPNKLLILDEPTAGLDPVLRERIWNYLNEIRKIEQTTILIATHYTEELKNVDCIGIMHEGRIIAERSPKSLMDLYNTEILDVAVSKWFQTQRIQVNVNTNDSQPFIHNSLHRRNDASWDQEALSSLTRIFAFTWINILNYFRLPIFAVLFVVFPAFAIFLAGLVLESPIAFTPYGIVNAEIDNWENRCTFLQERNETNSVSENHLVFENCATAFYSCMFVHHMKNSKVILPIYYPTICKAEKAVQRGDINGYISIPENYSTRLIERGIGDHYASNESLIGSVIKIYGWDTADLIRTIMTTWQMFLEFPGFLKLVSTTCNMKTAFSDIPLMYKQPVFGKLEDNIGTDIFPASVHAILFMGTFVFPPYMVIQGVQSGTFLRSRIYGLRFVEAAIGIIMFNIIAILISSTIVYLTLHYALEYTVNGNLLEFLCLTLVGCLSASVFGLCFSLILRTEYEIFYVGFFLTFVILHLSGAIRPEELVSRVFRNIPYYFFPSVSIIRSYRWLLNRGASLIHPEVWPGVCIALAWSVVLILLCLTGKRIARLF